MLLSSLFKNYIDQEFNGDWIDLTREEIEPVEKRNMEWFLSASENVDYVYVLDLCTYKPEAPKRLVIPTPYYARLLFNNQYWHRFVLGSELEKLTGKKLPKETYQSIPFIIY